MTGTPDKVKPKRDYAPPEGTLEVLYADDDILVLNKPSGLLSVPGRGDDMADCLELRARTEFPEARIVHRLDMDTSGVMVMALNAEAHKNLGRQFETRQTSKVYIARVWGVVEGDAGRIDLPLRCDWENRPLQMVDDDLGKPAQTDWKVIAREDSVTRVELRPITGRSHQLRVHMKELGHPILGDDLYAPSEAFDAADRLALHAESLRLFHPVTKEEMSFTCASPF